MSDIWAKLFADEKRGKVLVTKDFDADEDVDTVVLEVRGRAVMQVKLSFPDEEVRDKAFDAITQDNVAQVLKGGAAVLDRFDEVA